MKTRYKHIHFDKVTEDFANKPMYYCMNNKTKLWLADVFYYKPLKKYCFRSYEDAVFDESCLVDITDFLKQLNQIP